LATAKDLPDASFAGQQETYLNIQGAKAALEAIKKCWASLWTPLFAMASAVVTDIGGPLSHSSIVAREYGIPAVMAAGVATRLIHTGQMITVDGTIGTVTLA
jgi:phosphoenolpyruvate synthase/pyruvate phosphate dikinase